ncbi:hypothetical protein VTL71DRAFT_16019 [Oculimacula yallundae]|uniref:Uncharacterized protein n=1 Tax=Oculimacula yallundae TaxID=86028 RepID=A0ABR4CFC6_9HELO
MSRSQMVKIPWTRLDRLVHGFWLFDQTSLFDETHFLDFLHDGNGLCFLFFLSDYWRSSFDSEQMDWAAGLPLFSSTTSQDSGVRYICGTFVFYDCMAWIYLRWGAIAWSGTVKRFLFLSLGQLCH